LGAITHLKTGSTITEYSFDAWGRRRDKDDWSYTLTSEPALFADRGFTAHEFLADFNLYNMNGRLYDPVVGRFLSPDPYIADPSFSQSYNRYAYALNNPLKYNDPSGEINWPAIWLGNWIFGGMNNWINGGMPFKQAFSFKNNPMVASVNYHPGNNSWSNTQANAQNLVGQMAGGQQNINTTIAGFSGWNPISGSPRFGNGDIVNQQFVGESLSSVGGLGWEAYVGTAGDIAEEMYFSKTYGTWMGKNFKMYKQTWGGNGVTGGKNKFGKTTSNAIKWGGHALGAWNAYSTQRDYVAGKMGTGWMLAEQGTNTISTFGGIYGAAWGVGWEMGRAITTLDAYQEFKYNLWYNRIENAIGPPSPINEGAWYYFFNNY